MMENIYQRINAVRKSIGYVQKDKAVSTGAGGGSYKAVTHDAVTGMVRSALIEHGIIIVPDLVSATFNQKEEGSKQRLYEAVYLINFCNVDSPEDRVSMNISAHALDNGDKAPGKALSYATKYAILKLFNIETGEDDESRYQQEEFDLDSFISNIQSASTTDELKSRYVEAYNAASNIKDKESQKRIISEKDKRKKELETVSP